MLNNTNAKSVTLGRLHVAELADQARVTPTTVRYYARLGLLNPTREPDNGYRRFSNADLHRVKFVRQAQSFGLTIGDTKAILEMVDHGDSPCLQVETLVEHRLVEIRNRVAELQVLERRMTRALDSWAQMKHPAPRNGEFCPLIERVDADSEGRLGSMRNMKLNNCHHRSSDGANQSGPA